MDDSKHVQIIIAGLPGSGKTTVKEIIAKALLDAGLNATVAPEDEDNSVRRVATERYAKMMIEHGHTVGIQVRPIRVPIRKSQDDQ